MMISVSNGARLFEHDPFGKPPGSFPDHALGAQTGDLYSMRREPFLENLAHPL